MIVKAYDYNGRLWISKPCQKNSHRFKQILFDAQYILRAPCVFCKDGKLSWRIDFPKQPKKVDRRYKGLDGVVTWTIPTRLTAYPLTLN